MYAPHPKVYEAMKQKEIKAQHRMSHESNLKEHGWLKILLGVSVCAVFAFSF